MNECSRWKYSSAYCVNKIWEILLDQNINRTEAVRLYCCWQLCSLINWLNGCQANLIASLVEVKELCSMFISCYFMSYPMVSHEHWVLWHNIHVKPNKLLCGVVQFLMVNRGVVRWSESIQPADRATQLSAAIAVAPDSFSLIYI